MNQRAQTAVAIPEDVRRFAREQGVEERLPAVLEAAERVFPEGEVSIVYEEEPAVEAVRSLVVTVRGVKRGIPDLLDARHGYYRELAAVVGGPASCAFRLDLQTETEEEALEQRTQKKPPHIPDDVWAFAVPLRIAKNLSAVLDMTRRIFAGCEPTMSLEDDPELSGSRCIRVSMHGVPLEVEQGLEARWAWNAALGDACPGGQSYLFRLWMELAR
jgi:hypothetical protein